MQNQAVLLYHLQQVDLNIAQHRARLKEIEAQLSGDESVAQASKQFAEAQEALKPWQAHARDLDLEIKSVTEKIKTSDADLYSGRITNPKALQELQDEVDSLKRRQSQLEDEMLETMVKVEGHQTQVADAQQTLTDAQQSAASQQTELLDEQQRLASESTQLDAEREDLASIADPASLAIYEKMRPRFRGKVVAVMQDDGCTICGVEQTSVRALQVRLGREIVYCESCGRILANNS